MRTLFTFCFTVLTLTVSAQQDKKQPSTQPDKKPLTHDVYDGWKEISYRSITADGNYAAFTINPQDGDGKVVFCNLKTYSQDSVKRAIDINLTRDNQFAIFKIAPQKELVKDLRRQKKKKEDLPKDSLGIFSFVTKSLEKIPEVKSYKIPEKAGGWVAYQMEAKKETKPKAGEKPKEKPDSPKAKKIKKNSDDNGYTLVLKKLAEKKETQFGYVKEYAFAKYGQGLLFATTGNDSTLKPGVFWYDLKNEQLKLLYAGKSKYKIKGLSISEDGNQTSFLVDTDTTKSLIRFFKLYYWKNSDPLATLLADEKSNGITPSWTVSENYTPLFSKDGKWLFFGSAPIPVVQDTTLLSEEIVNVEVWTGNDEYIYPQQNRQLETEKKRSYLVAVDLATKSLSQLANENIPSIDLGDEGNSAVALGETNKPYRKMTTWDPSAFNDLYLFDLKAKTSKLIATKIKANSSLSPKAKYVFWFSLPDTAWFSYSVSSGKKTNLTENLPVTFADEEDDQPDYPGSYGSAGWTANDALFLAYDRYDIWGLDPEKRKAPVNLTKIGRSEKIVFRYVRLDPEERFINGEKELLLSAFNETTKASGFYFLNLKDGKLTKLLMSDHRYTNVMKALEGNTVIFSRQSFQEFSDVWASDIHFANPTKISTANPQMKNYKWGTVELVNWVSLDNIPLRGLLYKPENFDPQKKYPMIVYFYEKNSDALHQHVPPGPIRASINYAMYASNGYLVFVPDVVYKIGFPGESAHNCILPGVTSLMAKGFVDEKRIGIQGHSWGGYQIAYLVTRTNLFKAAEAGAPVSNMISAYGGVRWETGVSRMFQYEHSQSRIGGTLWEKPVLFVENSPIFFADRIQTPVLMMHNDADGAVPWYQGIEFYMALRRLNKPVWLLNYNGEGHGLTQRQNRTDLAKRMMQYFDYYLKDGPMPEWMRRGVPATEKGIKQGIAIQPN